jgi:hypothetical protein
VDDPEGFRQVRRVSGWPYGRLPSAAAPAFVWLRLA